MIHTLIDQSPTHPAPPVPWIVLGHSPEWLAAASQTLQSTTHPMLAWRRQARLVQVVDTPGLPMALQAALRAAPAQLQVVHEPGLPGDVDLALEQAHPRLDVQARVLVSADAPPFAKLLSMLQEPDGRPAEQWLRSGRRAWPSFAGPGVPEADAQAADTAFKAWAMEFEARHLADELDTIYGAGDEAAEPAGPTEDLLLPTALPAGQPAANQPLRPRLMAAAARGAVRPGWAMTGRLDEQAQQGPVDQYWLRAPGAPVLRGAEGKALGIELSLSPERWLGRRQLVLVLHAPHHPPVLVYLGDAIDGHQVKGELRIKQECDASQALLDALAEAGQVRLLYRPSRPSPTPRI